MFKILNNQNSKPPIPGPNRESCGESVGDRSEQPWLGTTATNRRGAQTLFSLVVGYSVWCGPGFLEGSRSDWWTSP